VIALTGSRSELAHRPLPQDDPTQRKPDVSLAREKLGWEATVRLQEGLKATIDYFEKRLSK
jgi:UDP-glucuronate decarboxylase